MSLRRPAFTLVEVLIAASSLAIISVIVVGIMSQVLVAYADYAETQKQVLQSQQALQRIGDDVRQASQVQVAGSGDGPADPGLPADTILVLSLPHLGSDGTAAYDAGGKPAAYDTAVYCVHTSASVTGGTANKVLYRFWKANTGTVALNAGVTTPICAVGVAGGLDSLVRPTAPGVTFNPSPVALTDPQVRPVSLKAWAVQMGSAIPAGAPLAMRLQLATQYAPGNLSATPVQQRASAGQRGPGQLVLRTTVERQAALSSFGSSK